MLFFSFGDIVFFNLILLRITREKYYELVNTISFGMDAELVFQLVRALTEPTEI